MKKLILVIGLLALSPGAFANVQAVHEVYTAMTTSTVFNQPNFPLHITGTAFISNTPADSVPISGTVFQGTFPWMVSGTVTAYIGAIPWSQTVHGDMNVTVQGSVTVIQGTDPWIVDGLIDILPPATGTTVFGDVGVLVDTNGDGVANKVLTGTPTGAGPNGTLLFTGDYFAAYNSLFVPQFGLHASTFADEIKPAASTAFGMKLVGSLGLGIINGNVAAGSAVFSRISATTFTHDDHLGIESGIARHVKVIGTALTAATIQGTVSVTGQVDTLPPATGTTIFGDAYMRVNINNDGLMTLVSGSPFHDGVALHNISVGYDVTASSYAVEVADSPANLTPTSIEHVNHLEIFNNGDETLYYGGANVSITSGVPIAANSGLILDNVAGALKVYGVISSTTPVDCRIGRF